MIRIKIQRLQNLGNECHLEENQLLKKSRVVGSKIDVYLSQNIFYIKSFQKMINNLPATDTGSFRLAFQSFILKRKEVHQLLLEDQKEINTYLQRNLNYIGLSRNRIEIFHHFPAEETSIGGITQCPSCMDNFEVGMMLVKLDCNHLLCADCTIKWLSGKNTCPVCRHPF